MTNTLYSRGNPYTVVSPTGTYSASEGEFVISDGSEITLPSPTQDGVVAVRGPANGAADVVPASGQIQLQNNGVAIQNGTDAVFVSDGSDWYVRNDADFFGLDIPESGLLHQYRFNDDSDTSTATDSEGSDNASLVNGPSYVTDSKDGENAISCDGTDDAIQTSHSAPEGGLTFALWFKTTDDGVEFLSQWNDNANGPFVGIGQGFYGGTSGAIHFGWRYSGANNANQVSTTTTNWNDGVWHHLAVTLDPSQSAATDQANIYLDGSAESLNSNESQGNNDGTFDTDPIYYAREDYNGLNADVILDRALEYDRILSSSEVSDIYNADA